MKALFNKYKLVVKFIATFLLVYICLSIAYKFYLQLSDGSAYYPDFITHLVAVQSTSLIETLGYQVQLLPHPNEPSLQVIINGKYLARVIEGCNAVSVIILFVSFIVAFSAKFKTTFFYILASSVLIYSINLIRIVFLSLALYHYPKYEVVLHTVVFPGIIYGFVFLLWVFWVNRFSKIKTTHA